MNKVISVIPLADYRLQLKFSTGEETVFDMTSYLDKGVFTQLRDVTVFKQAYIAWDTVCWSNELDISPDTLYLKSQKIPASGVA
ncbi:DUF2442 domain-containing protein [Thiomicrospira sp. R3]|uniref:DUF2442 domain-containing protein n=1 Tax=Thiomicrospira sp. R3 TaxID=3035472 RepID=UPI00259B7D3B|nr:DUF2442 domain-containing protein [Thiomicrospira sp. R3]WFE69100.1 DUF2442 domain-containing protein [Thiomicrospira sp. R3]